MVSKLAVFIQVLAEVSGDDPAAVRAAFLASAPPGTEEAMSAPITEEEAETLRNDGRAAMSKVRAAVHADPSLVDRADYVRTRRQIASFALKEHQKKHSQKEPLRPMDRSFFQRTGAHWWRHSFAQAKDASDTAQVMRALNAYLTELSTTNPDYAQQQSLLLQTEIGSTLMLGTALWAHYGFQTVCFHGHKYAAALMSTGIPSEGEINPPWDSFMIEIPDGLLTVTAGDGSTDLVSLRYVLVRRGPATLMTGEVLPEAWTFDAYTQAGTGLHRRGLPLDQLREAPEPDDRQPLCEAFDRPLDGRDDRVLFLLTRLVLNTCVAMADKDNVRPIGKRPKRDALGDERGAKEPLCRVYKVGSPVDMDCRPSLQDYVEGRKRNPLTVQFMVRGHWRWQAHGVGMLQRRRIWIIPHWKGPADVPILVRPHIL